MRSRARRLALGVLPGDDVRAVLVGADEPLPVDVGAVEVHRPAQRRRLLDHVGEEVVEELVHAVGCQLGVDPYDRGRPPARRRRGGPPSRGPCGGRRTPRPAALDHVHTGVPGSADASASRSCRAAATGEGVDRRRRRRRACGVGVRSGSRRAVAHDRGPELVHLADVPDEVGRRPARARSTVAPGPAARPASSSPSSRAAPRRGRRRRATSASRHRTRRRGQLGDRRQLVEVLVVVDVLVLPQQRVRDVHGVAADDSTGRMSLRTELPTMQNRSGSTPSWRRIAGTCRRPSPARPRRARSGGRARTSSPCGSGGRGRPW